MSMNVRLLVSLPVIAVCLALSGCKGVDDGAIILPQMDQYFPDSAIFKFDKRVLWIQTHVEGISGKVAQEIFAEACQKAVHSFFNIKLSMATELQLDGHEFLIIGFNKGCVACDLREGVDVNGIPHANIMGWPQAETWITEHLGYMPTKDQIYVERIQDVQNTPKGQPMHLQTLAQRQAFLKEQAQEKMQAQMQSQPQESKGDDLLKEEVEQQQKAEGL